MQLLALLLLQPLQPQEQQQQEQQKQQQVQEQHLDEIVLQHCLPLLMQAVQLQPLNRQTLRALSSLFGALCPPHRTLCTQQDLIHVGFRAQGLGFRV